MTKPVAFTLGALLVTALAIATRAQMPTQAPACTRLPEPRILSGVDVGFRVEGMLGDKPVGTLVIRVNGAWVDVANGLPGISRSR